MARGLQKGYLQLQALSGLMSLEVYLRIFYLSTETLSLLQDDSYR